MKKMIYAMTVFLLGIFAVRVWETARSLQTLEDGVLRLHILADSDTAEDQMYKLLVRDALLEQSEQWTDLADDREQMEAMLTENLPLIEEIAETTLRSAGCSDQVTATLCSMEFPARTYGDVTLPAGEYQALRLVIGSGSGQNWWCMMYPSLCIPAAAESSDAATAPSAVMEEYFDDNACALTERPDEYEVRLKCVELVRAIGDWFAEKFDKWSAQVTDETATFSEQATAECR